MIHEYAGTKFPIYKVWQLREASDHKPHKCEKGNLKHSMAEFQSIQQYVAAIGYCFIAPKIVLKC